MWYPATITTPAAADPVTLAEAKAHLRVDGTVEDSLITGLVASARDYVEAYTGIAIASRGITVKCDTFDDLAALSIAPVSAVASISYVDTSGATQTLAGTVYELRADGLTGSIALKYNQAWPEIQPGSRITVVATVGYATTPESLKLAILLLIALWYDNRAAASDRAMMPMPHAVDALLANYRIFAC